MKILRGFEDIPDMGYVVATIGSYDGVHRGHRILIDEVVRRARQHNGTSLVLTFEPHPRIALGKDEGLELLSTLDEKCALLEAAGVDFLLAIPFNRAFSALPHDAFVREYLVERLRVKELVVGYNHHFGRDREGSFASLLEVGDIIVTQIEQQRAEGDKISSTVIRHTLASGDMATVARLLGHPYIVYGRRGADNELTVDRYKMLPPIGEYMALVDGVPTKVEVTPRRTIRQDVPFINDSKIGFL